MSDRQSDERTRLARAGAERAASAFEMLVDRPTRVASVAAFDSGERGAAFSGEWSSGVFFELEGCFDALVAVMFRSDSRDALVERVTGAEAKDLADWCVDSALTEVANILASHVASGIAEKLGQRLLPSVPSLALDRADRALAEHLEGREDGSRIECELLERNGDLGGLLVLAPGRRRR